MLRSSTVPDNLQVGDLHASRVGPVTEFVTMLTVQVYGVSLARDRYCSYSETGKIKKLAGVCRGAHIA